MNTLPLSTPCSGILSLRDLNRLGYDRFRRAAAINAGELERLRNGWFAVPGTPVDLVRAVRLGGNLTCSSALQLHGVWVMPDDVVHVAVKGNAARLRSPDDRRKSWDAAAHPGVRLHWDQPGGARKSTRSGLDDVTSALAQLVICGDHEAAIVAIDSALNVRRNGEPLLLLSELQSMVHSLPLTHAAILEDVDGRSQAGTETLVRLRLRRRRVPVRVQVTIRGVGRVDGLIGDRIVLEIDSRAHHLGENYERDRLRDRELIARGFIVIRLSYRTVMFDWDAAEEAILQLVRRGEHLRDARDRRLGLALTMD